MPGWSPALGSSAFLAANPCATLTGGQRDDDHDGYGNRCDAKLTGLPSTVVGGLDLGRFRQLSGSTPGPRCALCTGTGSVLLPCTAGTAGACAP